jgi:hypothetical protein
MKVYEGVQVQVYHSSARHWIEVSGQFHTPATLPP